MWNLNKSFLEKLSTEPVFCFTSDIDWAPESMITETLNIFLENKVPLTPFITHNSKPIKEYYKGSNTKYVGLHPNFLPGSTHGSNFTEVISNLVNLWPDAKCFRSHCFVDNSFITKEFYDRGFKYDSNLCLYLQPYLVPLQHSSGLLRFPVFFEDDDYATRDQVWEVTRILALLKMPGLKLFNFHPVHVCLNTPNMDYYERVKRNVNEEWRDLVYEGKGVRTFISELLQFVGNNPGLEIFFLDDLYSLLTNTFRSSAVKSPIAAVELYDHSSVEQRVHTVRSDYEMRDGKEIYATSRDFNLREIEVEFIMKSIREYASLINERVPRILDIGCGNGYTDIRIAESLKAEIVGLDFSQQMITGAEYLKKRFKDQLMTDVTFRVGDVRKLNWDTGFFDVVISERCLLNLPDRDTQYDVIREVYSVLRKGGTYIMVEGTLNGLRRLNELRLRVGLNPIPDRAEDNASSLKFEEEEIEDFLCRYFKIIKKQHFGMYYLISRVVHPLLVWPDEPKFDAKINQIAREFTLSEPDYKQIGHVVGFVLQAI